MLLICYTIINTEPCFWYSWRMSIPHPHVVSHAWSFGMYARWKWSPERMYC